MFCIIDFWGGCLARPVLVFVFVLFVWACLGGCKNKMYFVYDFYCILLRKKGAGG